jgi:hypothetical protein
LIGRVASLIFSGVSNVGAIISGVHVDESGSKEHEAKLEVNQYEKDKESFLILASITDDFDCFMNFRHLNLKKGIKS